MDISYKKTLQERKGRIIVRTGFNPHKQYKTIDLSCRKKEIDFLKALAIFLVILGHAPLCHNGVKQVIYSFHMPLFFFIYGMTYSLKSHQERDFLTFQFFIQKVKRLMVPAYVWALSYSLLFSIYNHSWNFRYLIYIIYGSQYSLKNAHSLTSIWFLPVMFLAVCFIEIIMQTLHSYRLNKSITALCLIIILSIISFILPNFYYGYPWGLNIVPISVSFMLMGILFQEIEDQLYNDKRLSLYVFICTFIGLPLLYLVCILNLPYINKNNVDMASSTYGLYPLYMICALLGILITVIIAFFISKIVNNRFIFYIGLNTLSIFLIHKPLIQFICYYSASKGFSHWGLSIIYSIIILFICAVITKIIDYLLPEIIGNKRNK